MEARRGTGPSAAREHTGPFPPPRPLAGAAGGAGVGGGTQLVGASRSAGRPTATPSAQRLTEGGGTAPVSMTTAGNKQGARLPPPAGNGTRLPLPAPGAGVHCVPGRSPPLTPARPSRLRERARCHHVRSPHSFHWRLPREGPSCALNSSLRRKGQAFPIQHQSQGGQPVVRNVHPTGGRAWAGGGGPSAELARSAGACLSLPSVGGGRWLPLGYLLRCPPYCRPPAPRMLAAPPGWPGGRRHRCPQWAQLDRTAWEEGGRALLVMGACRCTPRDTEGCSQDNGHSTQLSCA